MAAMAKEIVVNPDEEESDDEEAVVEEVEEGGEGDLKGPKKRRRLKLYVVFHGDRTTRRLPHSVRVKCPRDGSWDEGPEGPALLKAAFIKRYSEVHPRAPLLVSNLTYLADKFGTALADDDVLKLYVETEGVLHLMLGDHGASKKKPNVVLQWGYNSVQSKAVLAPRPMGSLARSRVVAMDCGWLHACCVLESGGALAWGSNEFGQLGTGDEVKQPAPVPCKVDREVRLVKVCCGSYFTLVVDSKGELWTWGRYQASNWPTKFTETWANGYEKRKEFGIKGEVVIKVAAGEAHCAVATESSKLFTWGYNEQWQLGWGQHESEHQGQQKPRALSLPKQAPSQITPENPVVSLACGGQHTAVALADGCMYAWGSNYEGQIGHVLREAHGEPQQVSSMEHEKTIHVSCGRYSTLATTETGCAYFWGSLTGSAQQSGAAMPKQHKADGDAPPGEEGEAPAFGSEMAASSSSSGASRMLAGAAKQLLSSSVATGAIGEAHGILETTSGSLEGWGYNAYGQALAKIDRTTDIIEDPRHVDLGDHHRPGQTQVLEICVAGGTTTILTTGAAN